MEFWLLILIAILILIIVALFIKIYFLRKAAREIEESFSDRIATETNTLIDVSTGDRYMRRLAEGINIQLRKLRTERHRFQQGDMELKNAVTNISHDLRTPLTAIGGYLDLLEQEENSESVKRYIDIIRNRVGIMNQLTEELFRFSVIVTTKDNLVIEEVAVNSVLEESIAAFYTALNMRNIIPDIHMPSEPVVRKLDKAALSRVFSNVLSNVIKYSDGDLDITLSESGEIIFTNTASGLNEVQVSRLFDRFYTVEAARKSTGLGLAIARTLIEQMDGVISAKYREGRLSICIQLSS